VTNVPILIVGIMDQLVMRTCQKVNAQLNANMTNLCTVERVQEHMFMRENQIIISNRQVHVREQHTKIISGRVFIRDAATQLSWQRA
jgi:hypothetical protein